MYSFIDSLRQLHDLYRPNEPLPDRSLPREQLSTVFCKDVEFKQTVGARPTAIQLSRQLARKVRLFDDKQALVNKIVDLNFQ